MGTRQSSFEMPRDGNPGRRGYVAFRVGLSQNSNVTHFAIGHTSRGSMQRSFFKLTRVSALVGIVGAALLPELTFMLADGCSATSYYAR